MGLLDLAWWRDQAMGKSWKDYLQRFELDTGLEKCTYADRPFGNTEFVARIGEQFGRKWIRGRPKKELSPMPLRLPHKANCSQVNRKTRRSGVPFPRVVRAEAGHNSHAVNQFLVSVRRWGETPSGDVCRGANPGIQAGSGDKRRDEEVLKFQPVADFLAERGVNELMGNLC